MAKIKILVEGCSKKIDKGELVLSTVTLIQDGNLNIIVDPGANRQALLGGINKEGLEPENINYVILTHTHIDHALLAGIFCNAEIFDNSEIYLFDGRILPHEGFILGTKVRIIKTPGHDQFHCSVVVATEDMGNVVIAGDVFWWRNGEEQEADIRGLLEHKDPYVKDEPALKESRKKILEIADWIIPGHGRIFKTPKNKKVA